MAHSAGPADSAAEREQPTGELVKRLTGQISLLIRDELKMAQLEPSRGGQGRRRGSQGEAAPVTTSGAADRAPASPDSPQRLAEEIKRTREQPGETVEALTAVFLVRRWRRQ